MANDDESSQRQGEAAHPVFVGGVGRSGTTICGRLIGSHPRYGGVPFEMRAHLLTGPVARGNQPVGWFRKQADALYRRRLDRVFAADEFALLQERYEAALDSDPVKASRSFIEDLMAPVQEREGTASWVEMSPLNAMWGSWLHQLFPEMRLIHMLRDGRDVACSFVASSRGAMDVLEGLDLWHRRVRFIATDSEKLPEGKMLTVRLEDLATNDREASYRRIVDFLGAGDEPGMRSFFDEEIRPSESSARRRGKIGRWRQLERPERRSLQQGYRRALTDLRERGIGWVPSPDEV